MSRRRSLVAPRLFLGLVLIAAGVIFTLDELGIVDADDVVRFWPALLVAVGFVKLAFPGSGGRFAAVLFILIGSWLLAWELEWIDLSPWQLWPLVLVLIGFRLLARGFRGTAGNDAGDDATVNAMALLGATRRTSRSRDFRGGDLAAFMGGCELDLRQARIAEPPAVIDAFAMWGGVDVIVPRDWQVRVEGWPILAGFEDKTRGSDAATTFDEPRQELVVKGLAIMGGVEVKNEPGD